MKRLCIITGTSTGIGKAITERMLHEKCVVYGIGRRCTVKHFNYNHQKGDLRDLSVVLGFEFPTGDSFDQIILINNAGMLGEIKPMGRMEELSLAETYQVNLTAPAMLTNRFLAAYKDQADKLLILNISSGAAKSPVPGWGGYCSSKAGIDMLSEVIQIENRTNGLRVHSISPGIVETPMQEQIRSVPKTDFERVEDFIGYHKNKELESPAIVADKLWHLVQDEAMKGQVLVSFREYPSLSSRK